MKRENHRFSRIEKSILNTINTLISFKEIRALRNFDRVIATRLIPARDLSTAKVYFAINFIDGEEKERDLLIDRIKSSLTQARGFIQMQISYDLNMHSIPRLIFYYDKEYERITRVQNKLEEMKKKRQDEE